MQLRRREHVSRLAGTRGHALGICVLDGTRELCARTSEMYYIYMVVANGSAPLSAWRSACSQSKHFRQKFKGGGAVTRVGAL